MCGTRMPTPGPAHLREFHVPQPLQNHNRMCALTRVGTVPHRDEVVQYIPVRSLLWLCQFLLLLFSLYALLR